MKTTKSDKAKKNTHGKRPPKALRFFTYGVMTMLTIGITTFCLLLALGFRFDQQNLRFEQGGLIQVSSVPSGADVNVNDGQERYTTPGKSTLRPGNYTIQISKKGYTPWQKTVPLAASQVLWLNYIRLFPDKIDTEAMQEFASVSDSLPSPDRKWLAVVPSPESRELHIVDIADPTKPKLTTLALPDTQLTTGAAPGQLSIVEWDLDSRYVLVKFVSGDTTQYLRLDRTDAAKTVNISQKIQLNLSEVHFSGSNENLLYALDEGVLRRVDLGSDSISGALVTGVSAYELYGDDTVAYVASRPADDTSQMPYQQVGIYRASKDVEISRYPADKKLLIDYAEYYRREYLLVSYDTTIEVLRNPDETVGKKNNQVFQKITLPAPSQWLYFSSSGRMIVSQTGASATVYDLETTQQFTFKLETGAATPTKFRWLDEHHLYTTDGGKLQVAEFDGTQQRTIAEVKPGTPVTLSDNQKFIVSLSSPQDAGKVNLQRSKIQLD